MRTLTCITVLFFCLLEALSVNPASAKQLDFGIVTVGNSRELDVSYHTQGVTGITPYGCRKGMKIDKITIQGADADDFTVIDDGLSGQTCLPGSTHSAKIRFKPSKIGDEYAQLAPEAFAIDPTCKGTMASCDLLGIGAKKPKPAGSPDNQDATGPKIGDVVIYSIKGKIVHSGVISQMKSDGETVTKIISKWGAWGLYEHDPNDVTYGSEWQVWHSPRGANHLKLASPKNYVTDLNNPVVTFSSYKVRLDTFRQFSQLPFSPWLRWLDRGFRVTPTETECELAMGPALRVKILDGKIRVLGPPSLVYDCHGYTFTSGERWIGDVSVAGGEVDQILHDNGYKSVSALSSDGVQH